MVGAIQAMERSEEAISKAARKAGMRNPIRLQGQYFDHETGLHHNWHRYDDPYSGHYVSPRSSSLHHTWLLLQTR